MAKKGGKHGGARPGAGRKTKEVETGMHQALMNCSTQEEREKMLRLLLEDSLHVAFSIRHAARQLWLAYFYGKPVDRVEVSGEGGGPIPITIIEPVKPDA